MEKPLGKDEAPDGHLPTSAHTIDAGGQQVKVILLPAFRGTTVLAVGAGLDLDLEHYTAVEKRLQEGAKAQALKLQLEAKQSSAPVLHGSADDVADIKGVLNVTTELIEAIHVYGTELVKKAESLKQTLDGCRMKNTHQRDDKRSSTKRTHDVATQTQDHRETVERRETVAPNPGKGTQEIPPPAIKSSNGSSKQDLTYDASADAGTLTQGHTELVESRVVTVDPVPEKEIQEIPPPITKPPNNSSKQDVTHDLEKHAEPKDQLIHPTGTESILSPVEVETQQPVTKEISDHKASNDQKDDMKQSTGCVTEDAARDVIEKLKHTDSVEQSTGRVSEDATKNVIEELKLTDCVEESTGSVSEDATKNVIEELKLTDCVEESTGSVSEDATKNVIEELKLTDCVEESTGSESDDATKNVIEELKLTDCVEEGGEGNSEALLLQMDVKPSCSPATPSAEGEMQVSGIMDIKSEDKGQQNNRAAPLQDSSDKDAVIEADITAGKTLKDKINEEAHLKHEQLRLENSAEVRDETNINFKQQHAQEKVLKEHQKQVTSVPQKKAVNCNKKPSQKAQRKEQKRQRKANMESPQQPSDREKMVIAAVKEIWQAYDLGQGPKDLTKLLAPCPSAHYFRDNGQQVATSLKDDYLKYVYHLCWMVLQEIYPKPSATLVNDSGKRTHFSFRADFQDTITKEVLRQCGLLKQSHKKQHVPGRLVDEVEFIQVKITERMFENSLKKSNEKRYAEWMRIVNPGAEAKTCDYSKGDSALLSTTSVSENGPDKDGAHQRPSHSAHEKGTEKFTEEDSQPLKEETLEAHQGLPTPGSMTECSAIAVTTLIQNECVNEVPMMDTEGHAGDADSSLAPSQLEEDDSVAAEKESDQEVSEEPQSQHTKDSNTNTNTSEPHVEGNLAAQQVLLTSELSTSAAAPQSHGECITDATAVMDTGGLVGETASSLSSPQQKQDCSAAAEKGNDHDVSEECQSLNKEDTNITDGLSELYHEERPEAQQVLFQTESLSTAQSQEKCITNAPAMMATEEHDEDTVSAVAPSKQEEGHSAAAETGPGQGDSERHQSHQKEDSSATQELDEDTVSAVAPSKQEEGHSAAAETGPGQGDSERHQSHQKEDLLAELLQREKPKAGAFSPQTMGHVGDTGSSQEETMGHVGDTGSSQEEGSSAAAETEPDRDISEEPPHRACDGTDSQKASEEVSVLLTPSENDTAEEVKEQKAVELLTDTTLPSTSDSTLVKERTDTKINDGKDTLGRVESIDVSSEKAPLHLRKEDNAVNNSNGEVCHKDEKDSANDISAMIKEVSEPLKSTSEDTLKALTKNDTPVTTDSALPDRHKLADVTVRDPESVRSLVRFSQQPQDDVSSGEFQPGCPKGTQKQECDQQGAVKLPKGQNTPIPQRRTPATKKPPSRKALHKEEKRKRKATMDSPRQLSDKQEMVLCALKEIWDVCELGQGPKDLAQLKAPCPSEHYLEMHGQHLKTLRKYDYLQYVFHFTWKILQELYPRGPKMASAAKTRSNRNNNSSTQIPFSNSALFQDNIAKAVLKRCGLAQKKLQNLQPSSHLLDEQHFLAMMVTENFFELMMKETGETVNSMWNDFQKCSCSLLHPHSNLTPLPQ